MLDLLLWLSGAVGILAVVFFLLPMIIYTCVRSGTAGYLRAKQKFLDLKKGDCDECKGSKNRTDISGSQES